MYNSYAAIQAVWHDTTTMDNLRGAASGVAGAQEISYDSNYNTVGAGNTVHMFSNDTFEAANGADLLSDGNNFAHRYYQVWQDYSKLTHV